MRSSYDSTVSAESSEPLFEEGFVLSAVGHSYLEEALTSLGSIRHWHSSIPVAVFTDQESRAKSHFDIVFSTRPGDRRTEKIHALEETPFKKTVFLDTDTFVLAPLHDLFQVLDRFDLAAAHAPARWGWRGQSLAEGVCPQCFPEFNTGVLAMRNNQEMMEFCKQWSRLYSTQISRWPQVRADQPGFQRALYESKLNIYVLPPEYNFRTNYGGFVGDRSHIKILHGRHPRLDVLGQRLNTTTNFRHVICSSHDIGTSRVRLIKGRFSVVAQIAFIKNQVVFLVATCVATVKYKGGFYKRAFYRRMKAFRSVKDIIES